MQPMYGAVAALAVIAIYYLWRAYFAQTLQREQLLRRRVAFMLWMVAHRDHLLHAGDHDDGQAIDSDWSPDLSLSGP
jgi:hypothetical protein